MVGAHVIVFDALTSAKTAKSIKKPHHRFIGVLWESPSIYREVMDQNLMNIFDYEFGFRTKWSHLLSYNMMTNTAGDLSHMKEWDVVPFATKKLNPMVTAFISNCAVNSNGRLRVLEQFIKLGVTVKNRGRCHIEGTPRIKASDRKETYIHNDTFELSSPNWSLLRNKTLKPPNIATQIAWENMYQGGSSLFYYAAENSNCEDYHTEKVWNGFNSGAVPIYLGSNLTYKDHFPENSVIHVYDFPDLPSLAKHLLYLANNETAYNKYLEWRKNPLPKHVQEKIDHAKGSLQTRISSLKIHFYSDTQFCVSLAWKNPKWCKSCEYLHQNWNSPTRGFKAQDPARCL